MNSMSRVGPFIRGRSNFMFLYNMYKTWKTGERVTADDAWGFANSLEWATSCPPPRHNFTSIPRIRSERPAFDLHYPNIRSGRDRHAERVAVGASTDGSSEEGCLHESRGLPVPGLRRVLRRLGLRLLALLARPGRGHRARGGRRAGLPDRLLRALHRAAAAPAARRRPGRRDPAGHWRDRVLQPA